MTAPAVSIFGMFLNGSLVGRLRLYQNSATNTDLIGRVFRVCAALGIAGNAALIALHESTANYPPTGRWVLEQCIFAMCVACRIWLQFFRFGPLEWVWRRAT
jgi:uncharacterized protein DUF418